MTTKSHTIAEHVIQLGTDGNLIGVVTEASDAKRAAGARSADYIIVNAGVLHRVGPHRFHVDLARRLAASGFSGLRVDLSGIGDSRAVPSAMTFWASAVADIRLIMDDLKSSSSFVLIGLCSGADNSLAAALEDPRIKGLILLDPPAYATRRSKVRKLMSRLRQQSGPLAALQWIARQLLRRSSRVSATPAGAPSDESESGGRITPPSAEWGSQIRQLCDRGVRILCIYSGAYDERYNHADQIWEWFPDLRGRFDVWYEAASNHVFTSASIRQRLVAGIDAWCVTAFG